MTFSTQPPKLNEILKSARERKRATIQSAHQDTRISVIYLEALESGKYENFPAEVYCLGFLRKYSAYLGLNSEEMVALYKKEQDAAKEAIKETEEKQLVHEKEEKSNDLVKVMTLVLLLFFAGGGWLFTVLRSASKIKEVEAPPVIENIPVPEVQSPPPVRKEALVLTAHATDNVWLRILVDSKLSFEGFITTGSSRTWEAANDIFVRVGNTRAVTLTLNDHPVDIRSSAVKDINELLLTKDSVGKMAPPAPAPAQKLPVDPVAVKRSTAAVSHKSPVPPPQ